MDIDFKLPSEEADAYAEAMDRVNYHKIFKNVSARNSSLNSILSHLAADDEVSDNVKTAIYLQFSSNHWMQVWGIKNFTGDLLTKVAEEISIYDIDYVQIALQNKNWHWDAVHALMLNDKSRFDLRSRFLELVPSEALTPESLVTLVDIYKRYGRSGKYHALVHHYRYFYDPTHGLPHSWILKALEMM